MDILKGKRYDIMNVLWEEGRPLSAFEINDIAPELKMPTVRRCLELLLKENLIQVAGTSMNGKVYARNYTPLLSREDYLKDVYKRQVVYLMPNCWTLLARQRQIPPAIPPIIRAFFSCILDTVLLEVSDLPDALEAESEGEFLFFRIKISGIRTTAPIRERTALKVKPPTYFIPTL